MSRSGAGRSSAPAGVLRISWVRDGACSFRRIMATTIAGACCVMIRRWWADLRPAFAARCRAGQRDLRVRVHAMRHLDGSLMDVGPEVDRPVGTGVTSIAKRRARARWGRGACCRGRSRRTVAERPAWGMRPEAVPRRQAEEGATKAARTRSALAPMSRSGTWGAGQAPVVLYGLFVWSVRGCAPASSSNFAARARSATSMREWTPSFSKIRRT